MGAVGKVVFRLRMRDPRLLPAESHRRDLHAVFPAQALIDRGHLRLIRFLSLFGPGHIKNGDGFRRANHGEELTGRTVHDLQISHGMRAVL